MRALGCVVAIAIAGGMIVGCEGRPRTSTVPPEMTTSARSDGPAVVEIDLTRGLPESVPTSLLGSSRGRTHVELVRTLEAIGDSAHAKGVLVRFGTASVGLAEATEIGTLLGALGKAGKPVVCHADDYSNATLLLAALGCSRLWISPAGGVEAVGIAAQLLFGNKLLTRLHVDVDFLQIGKFKGAEEPFTRDGPSPEARASLEGTLHGIRAAWLEGLRAGRPGVAPDAFEDGPYSPDEAKAKGIIDDVGYPDDARDDAKKLASVDQTVLRFGSSESSAPVAHGVIEIFRSFSGSSHSGEPHVAVVRAVGAISMGGGSALGGSSGITERDLGRVIARLTKDESTKAVVIRIDSPGGSALASDLLWKRLMKLRAEKPIVVSVGGMAASGGYYLACTASKILAEPTSIVGSIGVVGGKLSIGHALDEIGVHAETIAASPDPGKAARAAYMSLFETWDDPTRARVLASMTAVYDLFLRRVAEGRSMPKEKVAESAEGRIFGGVEAKERGLVDELGGFERALELARELAKLPKDAPVAITGQGQGLLSTLIGVDDEDEGDSEESVIERGAHEATSAMVLGWLDHAPELGAFVASAEPLANGERTLAALPFVLRLR